MNKPYTIVHDEFDTELHYVMKTHWWRDKVVSAHRSKAAAVKAVEVLVNALNYEPHPCD